MSQQPKLENVEDEAFDWAAEVYESQPSNNSPTVDLTKYEVEFSVEKDPATGNESLSHFAVWEK